MSPETLAALRDIASVRGEDYENADSVLARALLELQREVDEKALIPFTSAERRWS